jgi:multiple sugar transport system permease protein
MLVNALLLKNGTISQIERGKRKFAYYIILPSIITIMVLYIYPVISAFIFSFTSYRLGHPENIMFTGVTQYAKRITDPQFLLALKNTLYITIAGVAIQLVMGLATSLALLNIPFGSKFFRTVFVIPMMLSPVVAALTWKYILDENIGVLNFIIRQIGFMDSSIQWLINPKIGLWSIVIVDTWVSAPFMLILLYAGLVTLPDDIIEAAVIDGTSKLQMFFRIILPMLKPIVFIAVLIRTMDAIRIFETVFVLTKGGPALKTEVLSLYIYRTMFTRLNVGGASATAFVMLFIMLILWVSIIKIMGEKLFYSE